MKIVITGGSGQVGVLLARAWHARGHEVVVLGRGSSGRPAAHAWRFVHWDAQTAGEWVKELDGADVLVNLAGRSVNCRYTPENRAEIMRSRVDSTRVLGEAVTQSARPPHVWLQSSTATIYAHRFDAANDEATGVIGGAETGAPDTWRFSIDVARAWEAAATGFTLPATRVVLLRSSMIMSPDRGGVFDTLLRLVRLGLGGTSGNGKQFVSWIHEHDFIAALDWLIERDHLSGAVNIAAPNPLPNAQFMRALREAWGTPVGLPAAAWMLEMGAVFMKTETELVLKSRRVVPKRLVDDGFAFGFATWTEAARELCARARVR